MRFEFKPLAESDLQLLFEWLNRPQVIEWWNGRTSLTEVRDKYLPRLSLDSSVHPYITRVNGVPVGFIQSYVVMAQQASGWWPHETDPGAVGIDQFLADAKNLGRGIGTVMVVQFVEFLFDDAVVTKIQTDPAPTNLRAIRCYEKVGFRKIGIVDTPDGPALLMVIERSWAFREDDLIILLGNLKSASVHKVQIILQPIGLPFVRSVLLMSKTGVSGAQRNFCTLNPTGRFRRFC